jgi:hypothetical protein
MDNTYPIPDLAMRVLAYRITTNYADEYIRIGEDTIIESVRRFCKVMIPIFRPTCLRASNEKTR